LKRISRKEGRFQFDTTTAMIAQRWLSSAMVIDYRPFRCFLSLRELRPELVRLNKHNLSVPLTLTYIPGSNSAGGKVKDIP
jgi:hypothetical protein